jgi:uncharacterized damage-inducible protein DinB
MKEGLIQELKTQEKFFMNTISCLTEEDSGFKPTEETYTVAQHVGHAAETIEWFFNGIFSNKGFDMDFENYAEHMKKYTSFEKCVEQFKEATANGIEQLKNASDDELMAPITGEIMTGSPKISVVGGIVDHTAHHRGALAVYARLLGKIPQMPYANM